MQLNGSAGVFGAPGLRIFTIGIAMREMPTVSTHASRLLRWPRGLLRRIENERLYHRYRNASMIPKRAFVDNIRLARMIATDPEFARLSIVECGTWRGGMSAALIETFGRGRTYHFFDSFAGLPPAKTIDGEVAIEWQKQNPSVNFDNCTASEDEFRATISRTGIDPGSVHIHPGLFENTVGGAEVGTIALLRLDGDWYDSTICCLEAFFPRVAVGGYIIFDDYGFWDGCTRAVHDYLSRHSRREPILRFGHSKVPYIAVQSS